MHKHICIHDSFVDVLISKQRPKVLLIWLSSFQPDDKYLMIINIAIFFYIGAVIRSAIGDTSYTQLNLILFL